jgi:hypothetical protein
MKRVSFDFSDEGRAHEGTTHRRRVVLFSHRFFVTERKLLCIKFLCVARVFGSAHCCSVLCKEVLGIRSVRSPTYMFRLHCV